MYTALSTHQNQRTKLCKLYIKPKTLLFTFWFTNTRICDFLTRMT